MAELAQPRQHIFRKSLVIPTEHGSWSWLLVPFVTGAAVAGLVGAEGPSALLSVILALVGGLCAFLIRQPAAAWLRMRRSQGNRSDESLAIGWTLGLAGVAGLCLIALLALGRAALLWLLGPFAAVLVAYLVATRRGRAGMRALWMELIGAVGLALMAPAALIAATGHLSEQGWALWGVMGLQNALGVLYVRLRLADTHQRPMNRSAMLWGHATGLAAVLLAGLFGWVPFLTALPFAGFLARAAWAVRQSRPVSDVRRFGFTEIGAEVLSGAWIVASYWLS
jgi:hypothetical protein